MSVAGFIARHPLLVISVWLLVALLATPLFMELNTVVKSIQYSLPPGSEAEQAEKLLTSIKSGGAHPAIIIVENVDLSDNATLVKLVRWGRVFNESFEEKKLGSNLVSVPVMLASINESIYQRLLEGIEKGSEGASEAYRALLQLNESYTIAYRNLTTMIEQLNEAVKGVVKADRGYSEAYHGLLMLTNASVAVAQGLVELDKRVVNATEQLLLVASKLNETASKLALLDKEASQLAANLTETAALLRSMLGNESIVSRIMEGVAFTWWQVSRTYEYMEAFNGNYTMYVAYTNLTLIDPRLAPLPSSEAKLVWLSVRNLTLQGIDPDRASLQVAEKLVAEQLATRDARLAKLLPLFTQVYWKMLEAEKQRLNVTSLASLYSLDPRQAPYTQLQVLSIARSAGGNATLYITSHADELVSTLLSEQMKRMGIDEETAVQLSQAAVEGRIPAYLAAKAVVELASRTYPEVSTVADLLIEAISRYDPGLEASLATNRTLAVRAASEMLVKLGVPRNIVELVAPLVEKNITSREAYATAAYRLIKEMLVRVKPEAVQLLPLVEKYDPLAEGRLVSDRATLKAAVMEALSRVAGERLAQLPRELVEWIVSRVVEGNQPSPEELREKAISLVESMLAEMVGKEKARLIVEILEKYDPEADATLARNTTLAVQALVEAFEGQEASIPVNKTVVIELVEHPEQLNETFCRLFREEALKRVPSEAKTLAERAINTLCEKGRLTDSDVWLLVREAIEENIGRISANFTGVSLPEWLKPQLVNAILAVARNETRPEVEAARLSTLILLRDVTPKVMSEAKGLLVARDLKGFIVMFEPSGNVSDERVEKILEAEKLVKETLSRFVSGFNVRMTSSDLVMKEVREYALEDIEKTSKISEAATFLVLLLILESLFAVAMPYLGIGLGIVLGGALVFLAARYGLIDVTNEAQTLMITTALGLGADYAGYLVHRFREEYAIVGDARRAVERALSTAGPAIVASAFTVIIGFASLLLGWDIAFLRSLGETIPITVAATALASLTLVPALLALLGGRSWFWWPRRPSIERHVGRESRLMKSLLRHHRVVLAVLVAVFLVAGYFYVNFHGSHDMKLMLPENADAVKAFDTLKREYMPGLTDPIFVTLKLPKSFHESIEMQTLVENLAKRIERVEGVGIVVAPNATSGETSSLVSSDGKIVALQVILSADPYSWDGEKTIREVHRIVHEYAETHGIEAYVGGAPFAVMEMDEILHERFYYRILPAASILMVAAFTGIFGALPVSIAALLVIIGAAMTGIMASVALFQWLLGKPILWFLHIVTMVAVLGVGMDYNSFFLARALEECRKTNCDVEKALPRAAGAVSLFVVGLALVVSSAYLSLMASSNVGMREMGFTLGLTVMLAGIMAAYLFTPLVIAVLRHRAWWPRGMKRKVVH
ncbi:RND superfamily exporter [Pyrolobus fumarii 1A]|uniref:RND superfamily exporter n=1 Tax=Pyrolobus fumarii (strain DSM 11204 / 1A) TaxID=694429 RepID=G0EES1_PYRF1|nr:MMPL family transporter [Pyrolobus fumarii]AEM38893.1 RND superfamily exporter [Pyrolobus fumarii 1A]